MSTIGLLLFCLISAVIAQSSSNASASTAAPLSSENPLFEKLDSKVFQVSPTDIENNTAQYVRSGSSLNRMLALSKEKLHTNGDIDAELKNTFSIDNLADQLGVTVTEPNLLGNFNDLDVQTASAPLSAETLLNQPQVFNALGLGALQSQSDNDLTRNSLLAQAINLYRQNAQSLNPDDLQSLLEESTSNLKQVQANDFKTPPTLPYNNLMGQQTQPQEVTSFFKRYQLPNYETLGAGNDQISELMKSLMNAPSKPNLNTDVQSLLTTANADPSLKLLQSVLGSQTEASAQPNFGNLVDIIKQVKPETTDSNTDLQSLFTQQLGQPNFQLNDVLQTSPQDSLSTNQFDSLYSLFQQGGNNQFDSLSSLFQQGTNNLGTQVVFKHQVPNLNVQNCKLAFEALLQKAYAQYMTLSSYPYCQKNGAQFLPDQPLPFEIVLVPVEKPSTNPVLPKMLWFLLKRLQNQPVQQNPNILPLLLELFVNNRPSPSPQPDPTPGPSPKPDLSPILLLLLKIMKNQQQVNPFHIYLYKLILEIIKKKTDEERPQPSVFPDVVDDKLPYPSVNPEELFPKYYPNNRPGPTPQPDIIPSPNFQDIPRIKDLYIIFNKYYPEKTLTYPDIIYLLKLINTLPRNVNDLLINNPLLNDVVFQLTRRSLNPKTVIGLIYKYFINTQQNQEVPPEIYPGSKVVVLKYQVKRQQPFVFQPYYYVQYKVPYAMFVNHLYKLLLAKPYLKQDRALLLKELLVLAIRSYGGMSTDLNGLSKELLVQSIIKQGAVPLEVRVVSDNNVSEQLKVMNGLTQLGGETISPPGNNGGSGTSNIWSYFIKQIGQSPVLTTTDGSPDKTFIQFLNNPAQPAQSQFSIQQNPVGSLGAN